MTIQPIIPLTAQAAQNPLAPLSASSIQLACVATDTPDAQEAFHALKKIYPFTSIEKSDVIIALGGDGFMLETLHKFMPYNKPIYGMNRGSVGFLMNSYTPDALAERLINAQSVILNPLEMRCYRTNGTKYSALAINEVSLLRETRQAAKIRVFVDSILRLEELICDGIILSTPAGSTAYNLSAHGPILPLGAPLLALTPISAFRPRRWRGAILPQQATVTIDIIEPEKRPVSAVADYTEVRDVKRVEIAATTKTAITLLFDPEHNLEERILKEQFST